MAGLVSTGRAYMASYAMCAAAGSSLKACVAPGGNGGVSAWRFEPPAGMLTVVLEPFLREYRRHPMARFAVWIAAYGAALWLVNRFGGGVPSLLRFLFWITFVPTVLYYLFRLVGFIRQRLLWRLRRRLIVTYLFIAVVPILLILLLVGLGAFILNGQFAAFRVAWRLRSHSNELQELNRVVIHMARQIREPSPEALADRLQRFYVNELSEHASSYPGLRITIRLGSLARAFHLDGRPLPKPASLPAWLDREEFGGIVAEEGQLSFCAAGRSRTPSGELTLVLFQPFTPELLDVVGRDIGPVGVITTQGEEPGARAPRVESGVRVQTEERRYVQRAEIKSKSIPLPEPSSRLDFTIFGASTLDPIIWGGDREQHLDEPVFVYVTSRIVTLNRQILATLGRFSGSYWIAFAVVATGFLVIELFALVIGIQLTRSITNTVDGLHDATQRVKAGDFSYRISLPARDQLSALGKAFDSMTASVEGLLRESQEKSRLESELEIARQVQARLFPKAAPEVAGMKLYGTCKPARVVSGDYYDFLRLDENRVGLVLGDVSGKGISAALLMAAIQSALHAQFYDGFFPQEGPRPIPISTAEVVGRLNRQLLESTPTEKYVTLFYAVYDSQTRQLTYTNAGHLPPLLFRHGSIERLRTGGTVVGLFSPVRYEEAVVELEPGDLLLAFTDGITEPESTYGEEFGEARVLEVVRRARHGPPEALVEEIYRSVSDWTGSPELQDDMTLLVAKALP